MRRFDTQRDAEDWAIELVMLRCKDMPVRDQIAELEKAGFRVGPPFHLPLFSEGGLVYPDPEPTRAVIAMVCGEERKVRVRLRGELDE